MSRWYRTIWYSFTSTAHLWSFRQKKSCTNWVPDLVCWHQQRGGNTNTQSLKGIIGRREECVPRFSWKPSVQRVFKARGHDCCGKNGQRWTLLNLGAIETAIINLNWNGSTVGLTKLLPKVPAAAGSCPDKWILRKQEASKMLQSHQPSPAACFDRAWRQEHRVHDVQHAVGGGHITADGCGSRIHLNSGMAVASEEFHGQKNDKTSSFKRGRRVGTCRYPLLAPWEDLSSRQNHGSWMSQQHGLCLLSRFWVIKICPGMPNQ